MNIFYSNNFRYNNMSNEDYNFHLVTEEDGILNTYGINYSKDDSELVLTFCYTDNFGNAEVWDSETLEFAHEWFISDEFRPFISEDNEEITYFLKGIKLEKRFTHDLKGLIDVIFEVYDNLGYKSQIVKIMDTSKSVSITNMSNINKMYKPIVIIENIDSDFVDIINITTNKERLQINNLKPNQVITIDNEIGTVIDSYGKNLLMDSNRKWLELQKGKNIIKVDGNCKIIIKSLYPVMI